MPVATPPLARGAPVYCTSRFEHSASGRTFVAEASDICMPATPVGGRLWRGNRAHGLVLRSARTGAMAPFTYSSTDYSGGDAAGWWFAYAGSDPRLAGYRVLVIND